MKSWFSEALWGELASEEIRTPGEDCSSPCSERLSRRPVGLGMGWRIPAASCWSKLRTDRCLDLVGNCSEDTVVDTPLRGDGLVRSAQLVRNYVHRPRQMLDMKVDVVTLTFGENVPGYVAQFRRVRSALFLQVVYARCVVRADHNWFVSQHRKEVI